MAMGRPIAPLTLTHQVRGELEAWSRSRTLAAGIVRRARIVLMAADGLNNKTIAQQVDLSGAMVGMWRTRFLAHGLVGPDFSNGAWHVRFELRDAANPDTPAMGASTAISLFGANSGGFIAQWYASPDAVGHSQEKIDAMCQEFVQYGDRVYRQQKGAASTSITSEAAALPRSCR